MMRSEKCRDKDRENNMKRQNDADQARGKKELERDLSV